MWRARSIRLGEAALCSPAWQRRESDDIIFESRREAAALNGRGARAAALRRCILVMRIVTALPHRATQRGLSEAGIVDQLLATKKRLSAATRDMGARGASWVMLASA